MVDRIQSREVLKKRMEKVFATNVSVIKTPPVSCWGFPIRQVLDQAKSVSSTGAWPQGGRAPPGLEALLNVSQLIVEQEMDLGETTLGRELPNKYHIKDINGQELFQAGEVGSATGGALRPFEIRFHNPNKQEVMRINRPLRCSCCCCCCSLCMQNLLVTAPPGQPIGRVVEKWNPISCRLQIENASQAPLARIKGPTCSACSCRNVNFKIMAVDSDTELGKIQKHWSGFTQESLTDADNFSITFPSELDVPSKGLILGACLLIDFMFFESSPERKDRKLRRRGVHY